MTHASALVLKISRQTTSLRKAIRKLMAQDVQLGTQRRSIARRVVNTSEKNGALKATLGAMSVKNANLG
jgi:hypothetical protein